MTMRSADDLARLWSCASRLSFFTLDELASHARVERDEAGRFISEHLQLFESVDDADQETWGVRTEALRQVAERAAAAAMTLDPISEDLKMSPAIRPTQLEQLERVLSFLETERDLDAETRELELFHAQMNLNGAQVIFRDQLAFQRAYAERTAQRLENARARLTHIHGPIDFGRPLQDRNDINAECWDDNADDLANAEHSLFDWSLRDSSINSNCLSETAGDPEAFVGGALERVQRQPAERAPYHAAVWVPEILTAWPTDRIQGLRNSLVTRLEEFRPEDPPEAFAVLSVLAAKLGAELAAAAIFQNLLTSRIERRLEGVNRRAVLRSLASFARPGSSTSWQIAANAACYFIGLPEVTAEDYVALAPAALRANMVNLEALLLKLAIHLGALGEPALRLTQAELTAVFRNIAMASHADTFTALIEVLADLVRDQQRGAWLLRQLAVPTHGALEFTDKCELADFGILLREQTAAALGVLAHKPIPVHIDYLSPAGEALNEIIHLNKRKRLAGTVINIDRALVRRSVTGLPGYQSDQVMTGR